MPLVPVSYSATAGVAALALLAVTAAFATTFRTLQLERVRHAATKLRLEEERRARVNAQKTHRAARRPQLVRGEGGATPVDEAHGAATTSEAAKGKAQDVSSGGKQPELMPRFPYLGLIRTMFSYRYGTPRQGALAKSTLGVLQLDQSVLNATALSGLEEFSHAWLLFIFNDNTNEHKIGQDLGTHKSMVRPPGMGGKKSGVLATRTPHRPSRLGLSLVRIISVDPKVGRLVVAGVDLLDYTPIVDVKPYVPFDAPAGDELTKYPDWVTNRAADGTSEEEAPVAVSFTPDALKDLKKALSSNESARVFLGKDVEAARLVVCEAARLDFRARHHGRYGGATKPEFETIKCTFADIVFEFKIEESGDKPHFVAQSCRYVPPETAA